MREKEKEREREKKGQRDVWTVQERGRGSRKEERTPGSTVPSAVHTLPRHISFHFIPLDPFNQNEWNTPPFPLP